MFNEEREDYLFRWKDIGNIQKGRPNLGETTSVAIYRLMQYTLRDVLIKEFNVDKADIEKMEFILTVEEDLDCSGLPVSQETICEYDEGFFAGILAAYTGKEFYVKETDCWTSGGTVCRYYAKLELQE